MTFAKSVSQQWNKQREERCERPGFYLVKDDKRHFISDRVDAQALHTVCDKVLSDKKGWDYWIDQSFGVDVDGCPAWCNVDRTDRFI